MHHEIIMQTLNSKNNEKEIESQVATATKAFSDTIAKQEAKN